MDPRCPEPLLGYVDWESLKVLWPIILRVTQKWVLYSTFILLPNWKISWWDNKKIGSCLFTPWKGIKFLSYTCCMLLSILKLLYLTKKINNTCAKCRLDLGEGRNVDIKECPRAVLRQQCIKYLGRVRRLIFQSDLLVQRSQNMIT